MASDERAGSLLVEILVALVLFSLVFLLVIDAFGIGVAQTRGVQSYTSAKVLADWALAEARTWISEGVAVEEQALSLTEEARRRFPGVAGQLPELRIERSLARVASGSRLHRVEVSVRWTEAHRRLPTSLVVRTLEREEI